MLTEYQVALLERAHRGDRWPTVLESPCTYTHTLTVVLIRQHVRAGEIKCSSFRKHSLSTVCVRVGGGDGAVKGLCVLVEPCMVVSAHHMFSSHNTYKPVKRTPPKSRRY